MTEYVVLHDFTSEIDTDLVLSAGEIIRVIEKDANGWWLGENSECERGYFPSTFVEIKKPSLPSRSNDGRALPKPTSQSDAKDKDCTLSDQNNEEDTDDEDKAVEHEKKFSRPVSMYGTPLVNGHLDFKTSRSEGVEYSLSSLEAFDDLMNDGFCIELKCASGKKECIVNGSRVSFHCSASVWDGAATVIHQFSKGDLTISVGFGQVTDGLDKALLKLANGDEAIITTSPMLCYGAVGYPPYVPPNSYIIYSVRIDEVDNNDNALMLAAVGPKELLNVSKLSRSRQNESFAAEKAVNPTVVFVPASDDTLTDLMLEEAAKTMNISHSNNNSN